MNEMEEKIFDFLGINELVILCFCQKNGKMEIYLWRGGIVRENI